GQFRRMGAKPVGIARAPAGLDLHVAADGPARLLQALQKCPVARLSERIVGGKVNEHADAPHPLLLRACREWPRGRAAEQGNEIATHHGAHPRPGTTAKYSRSRVCPWRASQQKATALVRFSNRPSGSSAFRLSTTPVSMSLTGSRFSSDSAPRPLYGAFRDDNQRGARFRARLNRATTLYAVGPRTGTTMQSCASAAKLRSGGPILPIGMQAN